MKVLEIYCRVSTDAQVEKGHSLGAQKKLGIAKAESLGMNYKIHEEKGKSAAHDDIENRPILQSLLDSCDEGIVTDIFVTELDRLTRSPIAMFYIKKVLIDNKVLLHTTNQTIDLTNTEDEFVSDLTALLSRRENTLRSKRSKRGMLEAVKKGKWIGVILPFGYRKDENGYLAVDPDEQITYNKIVEMSLAGNGTNTIAHYLNELGVPTRCKKVLPNGTKVRNKFTKEIRQVHNDEFIWRPGTIYTILTNTIYTGKRKYKNEIISSPRMIDDDTWEKVMNNLPKNRHFNVNRNKNHFYLLRGLLRCKRCGANLFGRIKTDERTYMCSSKRAKSCGLRSPNLDKLELLVWQMVANSEYHLEKIRCDLQNGMHNEKIREFNIQIDQNKKALIGLEQRAKNLIMLYETERITLDKFDERKAELDTETKAIKANNNALFKSMSSLNAAEESIKQLTAGVSQLSSRMNSLTQEERKEILNALVQNITVDWKEISRTHIIEIDFKISELNLEGCGCINNKGEVYIEEPHQKEKELVNAFEYFNQSNPDEQSPIQNFANKTTPPLAIAQALKLYDVAIETGEQKPMKLLALTCLQRNGSL